MTAIEDDARSVFLDAVGCPPDQWTALLDEACGQNTELRSRVEKLLDAHQIMGSIHAGRPADPAATVEGPHITERPGTVIGPYKLLQQIGEGGMGVVFMAEQERPVKRRVALKVIKPGMDTRQVIARFEAERQALAMMDHPNIAKVLDAGTTGGLRDESLGLRDEISSSATLNTQPSTLNPSPGRPYFVMELVQGVPITEYCDQCNLTTRERLELFVTVCQAVQHAHQKGVIHRDIKPTNVLVAMQDGRPAPKIIDFGVAKAIGQQLTEHTLMTAFAQIIGTPLYMSPEQAELSPLGVDTRSDIYSLGVLLYELLTGSTPLDKERLHAASYDELRRIIREEEPPRPSVRLSSLALRERAGVRVPSGSLPLAGRAGEGETAKLATTIAEHRRTDARRLYQMIRGELDWIVMKCLEKDRNRRYESASSLAHDIERYLNDEPVQACPPSLAYRLKKFVRRNKVALAFAALLLAGLGYLTYSNAAIRRERDAKAMVSARAKAISDMLHEMLVTPAPGGRLKGSQYTVREMLDDYAAGLGGQLADLPEAEAEIRLTIGRTYFFLGAFDRAEPHLKRAIELRRMLDGPQEESMALSLLSYGHNLSEQRRYDEAEPPLREALEIYHQRGVRGQLPLHTLAVLQHALGSAGRHNEAERVIQQAWAEMQRYDELPPKFAVNPVTDVIYICIGFADYFARTGKDEEAAEFLRRATHAEQRLRTPGESMSALQYLAKARLRLGDQTGYREACRELAGPSPPIADDHFNLGRIWTCCLGPNAVHDPSVLAKQAEEFAASNSLRAPYSDLLLLGAAYYRAGQYEQAADCLEQSIAQFPTDVPPSHGSVLWTKLFLTMTKWQQGKHDDARRLLAEIQPAIDRWLETPSFYWQYRVTTELLRDEAKAMIEPIETDEAVENKRQINDE